MRITKEQLKQIIKEELENVLSEESKAEQVLNNDPNEYYDKLPEAVKQLILPYLKSGEISGPKGLNKMFTLMKRIYNSGEINGKVLKTAELNPIESVAKLLGHDTKNWAQGEADSMELEKIKAMKGFLYGQQNKDMKLMQRAAKELEALGTNPADQELQKKTIAASQKS